LRRQKEVDLTPTVSKAEQTNSSIIFGDRLILKLFRRLETGINPELEIVRFLSARKFSFIPPLEGALEYNAPNGDTMTLGVLTAFVPNSKTAWEYTLDTLGRFYERIQTLPRSDARAPALPATSITQLAEVKMGEKDAELIGSYLQDMRMLGERTAALHLALGSETVDPNFRPEPWSPHAQRGLFQSIRNLTRHNFQLLSQRAKTLAPEVQPLARQVLDLEGALLQRLRRVYEHRLDAVRIRTHGDFHLDQVLYTGKDFLFIDFEGESSVSLSERSLKRSPFHDVARMILSFHYAAQVALRKQSEHGALQEGQMNAMAEWARYWSMWAGATFLKSYLEASRGAPHVPADPAAFNILIDAELLRSAVYELGDELTNRPEWAKIPLLAILELMTTEGKS
jgi:maltose alpha-D-glucosyltransferase/alpha-amylase